MTDHSALIERLEAMGRSHRAHESGLRKRLAAGDRSLSVQDPDNAARAAETCEKAAAALRDLTEWRDISTAPKDGREIILRRCERVGSASWIEWPESMFEEAGQGWSIGHDGDGWDGNKSPTHWLPLPSAPNQAKEAGE